jgi:hypothetical protein
MKQVLADLKEYILTDKDEPTFKSQYKGAESFEKVIDSFINLLDEEYEEYGTQYWLMDCADMGCSWLATWFEGSCWYINIDDIWDYWVKLNRDGYFD